MKGELRNYSEKIPVPEEIAELIAVLDVPTLREMSSAMLEASNDYVEGRTDKLQYLELLNSWIATAEETVAAGKDMRMILARRKGRND